MGAVRNHRLEEVRLVCTEERIEAELALGLHADLVRSSRLSRRTNRSANGSGEQLMLALYRAGRQAEALDGTCDSEHNWSTGSGSIPARVTGTATTDP